MRNRALRLAPDHYEAAINKGFDYIVWRGQLDTLRAVLKRLPGDLETRHEYVRLLLLDHRPETILDVLMNHHLRVFKDQSYYMPGTLYAAWAHQMLGDQMEAHAAFNTALAHLDSVKNVFPGDWRIHAARGMTLAGLGSREEALAEARWLQQSVEYRKDAYTYLGYDLALILVHAGEVEAALTEIERMLTEPCYMSMHQLKLDPLWDPIRDHPEFKALLAKYGD